MIAGTVNIKDNFTVLNDIQLLELGGKHRNVHFQTPSHENRKPNKPKL